MSKKGFTLVELMIVVAIIGILASIAIPNAVDYSYRAKRAEGPINVDAIKTAEVSYEATFDSYIAATGHPTGAHGKKLRDWDGGNSQFQELGWKPDGTVRGTYTVTTTSSDFTVTVEMDVDGDLVDAVYTATRSTQTLFLNQNDTY